MWHPQSWRNLAAKQQPVYGDLATSLPDIVSKVQSLPPLVHPTEVDSLLAEIALAQEGKKFLLQGGDCAERFVDCTQEMIENKIKILLQMSLVLSFESKMSIIKMGRLAGQYSKPRSSDMEKVKDNGGNVIEIPTYKGDSVHGFPATKESRRHDPNRLLEAHMHSACTLNYIRSMVRGGFASLDNSAMWDLGGVRDERKRGRYQVVTDQIVSSLEFMKQCGVLTSHNASEVDFFTCHEGLLLEYEAAVTKTHKGRDGKTRYYNLGAHMLWIGNRTREIDGATVEYFRGIVNPIGIKVGTDLSDKPQDLIDLIKFLNPTNLPGRITLISRMGIKGVRFGLPPLIKAVKQAHLRVLWSCDPMHGNTFSSDSGIKTRKVSDILGELTATFDVHKQNDSFLGGMHLEMTGEYVTECVGGPEQLTQGDLALRYTSYCDPRLNYLQSMEISFIIADKLKAERLKNGNVVTSSL